MMLKIRKNKVAVSIYMISMFFLLLTHDFFDQQLSGMVRKTEGKHESNFTEDAVPLGEITADVVLRQELELPESVLQVGVRFGAYMRENNAKYQMVLYDNEGNILAKRVLSADSVEDNQMCYLQLHGKTSKKISYVLEISSNDATAGNAVTGYGVPVRSGHNSCTWNGQSIEKELVIEIVIQKLFPVTISIAGVLTVCFVLFLFRTDIKNVVAQLIKLIVLCWNKKKKTIIYANLILSVVGIFLTILLPKKEYCLLRDVWDEEQITVYQYDEKQTQKFTGTKDFEAIEIKLATYEQSYQQGELYFALYKDATGELLAEKSVSAKQIRDNKFLVFDFKRIVVNEPTEFRFELWTEGFGEQLSGVYRTADSERLQYNLLQKERTVSAVWLLCFIGWGLLGLLVLLYCYAPMKKSYKRLLVTAVISILVGLQFSTYANYRSFSIEALVKNLGLDKKGDLIEWDAGQIRTRTTRTYQYKAQGDVYGVFDQIVLEGIQTNVDTIELYLKRTDYLKQNTAAVYVDDGRGFKGRPDIEYHYIHKGQEKIIIPISEENKAERVIISFSMLNEAGMSEEELNSYQYYSLERLVFNGEKLLWYKQWKVMLIGILFIWIAYVWKKCRAEDVLEQWLQHKGNRIEKVFCFLILLFGMIFSVLIPFFQTPDEPAHMQYVYQSIGAEELYEQVIKKGGEAVYGVMQNGAMTVDAETYSSVLSERLDSYRFSFHPTLDMLKYPGQVCGVLIGVVLHLPIGWLAFLSELCALLLYGAIGACAIHFMPIKKELLMMVLLMPIAVQQAASFSYDSFNNAVAALTVAYILYLALEKGKVEVRDLIKVAGMLFVLLWIKKVYVLCGVLLLLIPFHKYQFSIFREKMRLRNRKARYVFWGVTGAASLLCIGIVTFLLLRWKVIATILKPVQYPKEIGVLLLETVRISVLLWIRQGSAMFGWLDGMIYEWIVWVIIIGLLVASFLKKKDFSIWNWKRYMICLAVFLISAVGIMLSMVTWSSFIFESTGSILNQLLIFPYIAGVQGRYFLPILVLIFLFPITKRMDKIRRYIPLRLILIVCMSTSIGYSIFILLRRYWIA